MVALQIAMYMIIIIMAIKVMVIMIQATKFL